MLNQNALIIRAGNSSSHRTGDNPERLPHLNAWNPGTRYVMAHCAFDANAIALTAPEAKRFLQAGGFKILRTDFLFIFPRVLKWLRGVEKLVSKLPLGAQYQVLCQKPARVDEISNLRSTG